MLVLRLLVLQFNYLLVKFVTVTLDSILFILGGLQLVLEAILCILQLLLKRLSSLLLTSQLVLSLTQTRLRLKHLLSHVLTEVDVSNSLLHHKVDGVDGVLDVLWLSPEDITNRWHTITLLRLSDVFQIVHQPGNLHLLFILGITELARRVSCTAHLRVLEASTSKVGIQCVKVVLCSFHA